MADTQSNIQVNIDTTQALASIKNLQRQISAFHSSIAKGGAAANAVSAQMQQTLINSINATGKFSAQIRTIRTTTESFTSALEKNKFSLGEYFRYAGGASKTFGRLFKTEQDTINKVARENVKDLQTQYIRMGRDASGAMKAIAVRPLSLDMTDLATRTQLAAQKQAILNQLLKQGSTNLLNFGKNTQWAGRQLMVGFTLPLIAVGSAAAKTFMDMETQAIRFKKVYGDLFTPNAESAQALKDIQELGKEFTKYGIAVSSTVGLAAEAAAAGFKGVDLTRQTTAATRLSILGQVESQKALETTIALQNAFSMSSENLAESIDFLNAVENQTVLSLDDVSTAIPKAAPIIQQLGGDVKDLAFFMTAMKEGGINASEGANAIKSGLASIINPTGKASAMLESFGINVKKIVVDNKGDLKKTVVEFATALNMLDPLNRAQAIEQMFGKFQFARLSTLFANVTKEGTQASRVLDLAGSSVQDLAALSEKELGMTSESAMNKFKGAVESLKLSLIPLGEQFLKAVTPIAEFITKILDKFNGLSDRTKKIIVVITSLVAGLGPVLLMTAGLVMNGLANMIKLFAFLKSAFNKTGQSTATLGTEVKYMTTEQRNAAAVAASLDQVHTKLAQTFTSEASAVNALTRAYQRAIAAQSQFVPVGPPITRGPIKKFAGGRPATVGGTGNKDSELALLMPGETVIPTAMSQKYGGIINAMIADKIPGYEDGKTRSLYGGQERLLDPYTMFAPGNTPGGFGMDRAFLSSPDFARSLTNTIATSGGIEGGIRMTQRTMDELLREASPFADEITEQLRIAAQELTDAGTDATHISQLFAKKKKEIDQILSRMTASGPRGAAMARGTQVFAYPTDQDILSGGNARVPGVDIDENGNIVRAAPRSDRTGKAKRFQNLLKKVTARNPLSTQARVTRAHVVPEERVIPGGIRPLGGGVLSLPEDKQAAARAELEKRHIKLSKELGIKDIKAYDSGVKSVKVKDPYEQSRNRSSPHRLAAQDGRDDARAYAAARDKEIRKQSGRARRVATRPQGPAPIGATPQPGMTVLPIVPGGTGTPPDPNAKPKTTPDPNAKPKTTLKGIAGKMTGMGGGMGLLGLNMGLSMAPDFAGKGMLQGATTGANLGMFFGPKGMAVGAFIGGINSAFSSLNAKIKEYGEVNKSAFAISNSLITAFGDKVLDASIKVTALSKSSIGLKDIFGLLSPEVQALIDDLKNLPEDDPLAIFIKKISKTGQSLSEVTGNIRSRITTDIALGGLDPKNAQKYVFTLLSAAGKANEFGAVWKSISKDVIDESTATTASFNKLGDAVSKAGGEFIFLGSRGTLTKYEDLRSSAKFLADQMFTFFKVLTNGSFTFDEMQKRIAAFDASSVDAKSSVLALEAAIKASGSPELIERFSLIKRMFAATGQEATATAGDFVIAHQALEMFAENKISIKDMKEELFGMSTAASVLSEELIVANYIGKNMKNVKAYIDSMAAMRKEWEKSFSPNAYEEYNDGTDKAKTATELYLEVLEKEIKELEAKRDAQKNANDETQRQIDLQMKLKDLARESVLAKISGDYIKATNLQQQAQNVQMEFDQETALRKKDAEIARLKAREAQIKGGANLTKAEAAKIPKNAGRKKAASGGMIRGAGTGTSDSIPAYLSNGEYVIKADSVKKYGVSTFDALNTQRFAAGGIVQDPNKVYLPDGTEARRMSREERDANYRLSRERFLAQRKKYKDFVMPGLTTKEIIRMSGAIPGFKEGGLASRPKYGNKQNWFQRYVAKLTKSQKEGAKMLPSFMSMNGKADALGVGSLLRKITGQDESGDTLNAALFPLNFLGMGSARGALAKPAAKTASKSQGLFSKLFNLPASRRAETLLKNKQMEEQLAEEARKTAEALEFLKNNPRPVRPGAPGAPPAAPKSAWDEALEELLTPSSPEASATVAPKSGIKDIVKNIGKVIAKPITTPANFVKQIGQRISSAWRLGRNEKIRWEGNFDSAGRERLLAESINRVVGSFASRFNPKLTLQNKLKAQGPNGIESDAYSVLQRYMSEPGKRPNPYALSYKNIPKNILEKFVKSPARKVGDFATRSKNVVSTAIDDIRFGRGMGSKNPFIRNMAAARYQFGQSNYRVAGDYAIQSIIDSLPGGFGGLAQILRGVHRTPTPYVTAPKSPIERVLEARAGISQFPTNAFGPGNYFATSKVTSDKHFAGIGKFVYKTKLTPSAVLKILRSKGFATSDEVAKIAEKNGMSGTTLESIEYDADHPLIKALIDEGYLGYRHGDAFTNWMMGVMPGMGFKLIGKPVNTNAPKSVIKKANGGLIKGPGTGTSDSIRANLGYAGGGSIRVSNGEYVVKASSVRDYGVKTMDAINNGTAAIGTNSGGTVYNINMPITSNNADAEGVANEVIRKLKLEISKNNKTNKVGG